MWEIRLARKTVLHERKPQGLIRTFHWLALKLLMAPSKGRRKGRLQVQGLREAL